MLSNQSARAMAYALIIMSCLTGAGAMAQEGESPTSAQCKNRAGVRLMASTTLSATEQKSSQGNRAMPSPTAAKCKPGDQRCKTTD